jgi:hypothetical protein
MAYKTPVNIRALEKKGLLSEDRFFRLLSEQNNYVESKAVKDFYMGLVRLVTKELKDSGFVRLPHLGDLALVKMKDHLGWAGQYRMMMQGKYTLRFYPKEAWKKYFAKLADRSGIEGKMDPREKVLGQNLDSME